jgi:hypothetical protein
MLKDLIDFVENWDSFGLVLNIAKITLSFFES